MNFFGDPVKRKINRRIRWLKKTGCDNGGCPATLSCSRTAKALEFCAKYQQGINPFSDTEVAAE